MSKAKKEYYEFKDNENINTDSLMNLLRNYISELEKRNEEMLNALKLFVTRVEMGEVRSKKTYAQFKEIIEKYSEYK